MTRQEAINKLLAWCAAQIGYHEGANNWNKYAEDPLLRQLLGWYPQNQPWCDLWTDEAFLQCFGLQATSEMTYQPIGRGSAACRASAQFFKDNGAFFYTPEPGDVIFFYYDGAINHQGIVEKLSDGIVTTIEGNSSDGVYRRSYTLTDDKIAGYGRPKWDVVAGDNETETPAPAQDEGGGDEPVKETWITVNVPLPILRRGNIGNPVGNAQALLISHGYYCGGKVVNGKEIPDNDFGPTTEKAVRSFQELYGLEQDGVIGAETWLALVMR